MYRLLSSSYTAFNARHYPVAGDSNCPRIPKGWSVRAVDIQASKDSRCTRNRPFNAQNVFAAPSALLVLVSMLTRKGATPRTNDDDDDGTERYFGCAT